MKLYYDHTTRNVAIRATHQSPTPNELVCVANLSMIRASRGDPEGARALLWRAYNAGMYWVLPQIGELHEEQGALRQAERIYRRSIRELGRLSWTAVTGLLRVYESTGRHDRAYALAMAKPKDFLPIFATARAKGGDRAGAERLLLKLVDAGHPRFLVQAASMRKHEGDLEGARRMLRRARDAGVGGAEKALREFQARDTLPSGESG
ncbi:hypothetical protein DL990_28945 [Amycolatopsis sp. WAC 01416]|uniref:tetratricopeptide repeat protein n=1 Tax=Amycolatopsis sp. WAC 01416 TaxID=2203196 RepID=UPI000F7B6096|nr:hypothetical protein [Amycolatopsis sp. WAC 01416]RSN27238.1 hypothetical protein DL990_28945 [Amycolatopsis sp. WAC 01416]